MKSNRALKTAERAAVQFSKTKINSVSESLLLHAVIEFDTEYSVKQFILDSVDIIPSDYILKSNIWNYFLENRIKSVFFNGQDVTDQVIALFKEKIQDLEIEEINQKVELREKINNAITNDSWLDLGSLVQTYGEKLVNTQLKETPIIEVKGALNSYVKFKNA